MWWLYQAVMGAALALVGPLLLLGRRGRHYRSSLRGRLGHGAAPGQPPGGLWIHAVSVGEVTVAATLVPALPADLPLLVTTITPTGQARAQALFAGRADVSYLPFDLGFAVDRFLDRHDPAALVLVEGDFWPLVLRRAQGRGMPIAVVNGRLSDRAFRRQRPWRHLFFRPLFGPVSRFGVQTDEDRRRFLGLGVPAERIAVTGNLKFETPPPNPAAAIHSIARQAAGGRPVLVAGSTMRGEEEAVLDAFALAGGGARALLVLAPRHPERWDAVAAVVERRGFRAARRSRDEAAAGAAALPDVLLLDTLGELADLYRVARGAFIGGTLVPTGGHNPLEAARFGVAVAVGPSMENFRQTAELFDRAGAWRRVGSAEDLGATFREWLTDEPRAAALGAAGRVATQAQAGALGRTLAFLAPLLDHVRRQSERRAGEDG